MNRKAKFAYFYMVIGLVLFLFGFLIILNHNLNNDWKLLGGESRSLLKQKYNFTELLIIATRSKSFKSNDLNIYLFLFCQLKYDYNSIYFDDNPIDLAASFPNYNPNSFESLLQTKLFKSEILKNIFSFLICSSEKVYISVIVGITILGCLLLCYGCIRFYKYDIKVIQNSSSNYQVNSTSERSLEENVKNETNLDCCCFYFKKNIIRIKNPLFHWWPMNILSLKQN